jgi:hypothetical protein
MEMAFVERVVFVFLLMYLTISLTSALIHWHVALEWFKSIIPQFSIKKQPVRSYFLAITFILTTSLIDIKFDEGRIFEGVKIWLQGILPLQLIGILILRWIIRREKV